jgi:hypothetical protein
MLGRVGKGIGEAFARKTMSKEDYARIIRQEKEPKPEIKQPTITESFKQLKDFAVEMYDGDVHSVLHQARASCRI